VRVGGYGDDSLKLTQDKDSGCFLKSSRILLGLYVTHWNTYTAEARPSVPVDLGTLKPMTSNRTNIETLHLLDNRRRIQIRRISFDICALILVTMFLPFFSLFGIKSNFRYYKVLESRDSSVGTGLGYGLEDRTSRVRFLAGAGNFSLHHRVQNGSGTHPASHPMGTRGSFPGGKAAGAWSWPLTSI
jgi:hypothetical protein